MEELVHGHLSVQCLRRGVAFTADGEAYVPCRVFHTAALTHAEWERPLAGLTPE
jgi:hypothetical protein